MAARGTRRPHVRTPRPRKVNVSRRSGGGGKSGGCALILLLLVSLPALAAVVSR
ncbi:MAG TPA: hypothetical protein VF174_15800 [Micromonosporaceae bacterium]